MRLATVFIALVAAKATQSRLSCYQCEEESPCYRSDLVSQTQPENHTVCFIQQKSDGQVIGAGSTTTPKRCESIIDWGPEIWGGCCGPLVDNCNQWYYTKDEWIGIGMSAFLSVVALIYSVVKYLQFAKRVGRWPFSSGDSNEEENGAVIRGGETALALPNNPTIGTVPGETTLALPNNPTIGTIPSPSDSPSIGCSIS